jgi:predicted lysophospholipase L1 biosynthesis ABC-type transport system permease subunit
MDVVVNRRFVDLLVDPTQDAIGLGVELSWARGRIVGVVGDVAPALGEPARPIVYLPFQRETVPGMWVTVRAVGEAAALVPGIREAVHEVDRWVPLQRVDLLGESVESSVAPQRFNMLLVVSFAALALVLAAVGIYGVTALAVASRRSEIGIRRALGASDPLVAAEIVKRVAQLTGVGLVVGLLAASAGGRLLGSVVVGVEPTDPGVLAVVIALLGAVAVLAAGIPVVRAIRIEPTEALRAE